MSELAFGSWPTPITSELVVAAARQPSELRVDGDDVWWSELRPGEGGRYQLVRRTPDGATHDTLGAGWNARTAVHEYGGGAFFVADGDVWFSNWADQRLWRAEPGQEPVAVTAEPAEPRADRWADGEVGPDGSIVIVHEHHPPGGAPADVVNTLVRIGPDGGEPEVLRAGPDFVASPRRSPDGTLLAWIEWDHPDMPWDSTRLVVRGPDGDDRVVAGGPGESAVQPRWLPDGALGFVSDRSGWWHLYRWTPGGEVEPLLTPDGELNVPQWVFGLSAWTPLPDGRIVASVAHDGRDEMHVRLPDGSSQHLDLPFTTLGSLHAHRDGVVCIAASPTMERAVTYVPIDGMAAGPLELLSTPRDLGLDQSWFSRAPARQLPDG